MAISIRSILIKPLHSPRSVERHNYNNIISLIRLKYQSERSESSVSMWFVRTKSLHLIQIYPVVRQPHPVALSPYHPPPLDY